MAICSNCQSETSRVRTNFKDDGSQHDSCPNCAPLTFDAVHNPSERKIWCGWETKPNMYKKTYDKDGLIYMAKDELKQDTEDAIRAQPQEELRAGELAIAEKRANRRTEPITQAELDAALNVAREVAFNIEAFHAKAEHERKLAEIDQWTAQEVINARKSESTAIQ